MGQEPNKKKMLIGEDYEVNVHCEHKTTNQYLNKQKKKLKARGEVGRYKNELKNKTKE